MAGYYSPSAAMSRWFGRSPTEPQKRFEKDFQATPARPPVAAGSVGNMSIDSSVMLQPVGSPDGLPDVTAAPQTSPPVISSTPVAPGSVGGYSVMVPEYLTPVAGPMTSVPGNGANGLAVGLTSVPGNGVNSLPVGLTSVPGNGVNGLAVGLTSVPNNGTNGLAVGPTSAPGIGINGPVVKPTTSPDTLFGDDDEETGPGKPVRRETDRRREYGNSRRDRAPGRRDEYEDRYAVTSTPVAARRKEYRNSREEGDRIYGRRVKQPSDTGDGRRTDKCSWDRNERPGSGTDQCSR
eukprot:GHVT01019509.1.p2 GENE.GHVT01019509.1~~GHVT01019509.1.p2  ORF type:complete len:293 (-),score=1.75 GHVT01019509.1:125-1003(-)